ncbi:MAG TPA: M48 family metallopeptidase [Bacteroidota bacterium]|nr:M48 family metallopeptidase [Bacteroidota bacterium]
MNPYGVIVLSTLLVEYVLHLLANVLNIKSLRPDVPEEFQGVFDPDAYRKSQNYTKTVTTFSNITSTFNLILILSFWFAGGFNRLDVVIRSLNMGFLFSGLIYIGSLVFLQALVSLPFRIYSIFVIEERFGFNKTTRRIFILDLIKEALLTILLGGPLIAGLLVIFYNIGAGGWLLCWLLSIVFILFIQYIAPTWIMPLFNKFTPLEEGELKQAILSYANSVRFPLKGVFSMDGSKRSTKTNAFFTGFGKQKRIALFDTLINKHTIDELVAILAHEIGHYKKHHIIKGMIFTIIHTGVIFFLMSLFIGNQGLFDSFYIENVSAYVSLVLFMLLYSPVELIVGIFSQLISRKHEYEADRFAEETITHPESMIAALKKLSVDNLSNLTPHPFYVFLNYSHPPVLERIKAMKHSNFDKVSKV